ncbi:hypothetical protein BDZ94DRAFT_1263429 [Collybia nuda]|uniref:Uncharacterized protein n=1 Tax=Collybia nuda TaxID=64659 RepID=A0A9P5Y396_9AGAR|nr:hypothetical protein BDZ94DRAFT_1263429 [Collybia nuda]
MYVTTSSSAPQSNLQIHSISKVPSPKSHVPFFIFHYLFSNCSSHHHHDPWISRHPRYRTYLRI